MVFKTNDEIEGYPVIIILREYTRRRMLGTCFRGVDKMLAGNFCLWHNHHAMLYYNHFLNSGIVADAREAYKDGARTSGFSVDYRETVGWSSTDDLSKYRNGTLEEFKLGSRSNAHGLRIKKSCNHIKAPKTNLITFVYELKREPSQFTIIINSIYPGPDIGELEGDVSTREEVVFFDWNHPGEPL